LVKDVRRGRENMAASQERRVRVLRKQQDDVSRGNGKEKRACGNFYPEGRPLRRRIRTKRESGRIEPRGGSTLISS